jgi:hypothetical protein
VLANTSFTPLGSNALLLHAKSSRRTFAIGIKLARKTSSKKFQHHLSFLNKDVTLAETLVLLTLPPKPQPLCEFKEGEKEGGKGVKCVQR